MTRTRLLGIALFQAAWLACAVSGATGRLWLAALVAGPVVVWNLANAPRPAGAALLTAGAVAAGPLADAALVAAGVLAVEPAPLAGVLMPAWWLLLWAAFASSLPVGLWWLAGRPRAAALLGATTGPASYWAGERLGALAFPAGTLPALGWVAACWAILCPVLAVASARASAAPAGRKRGRTP